MEPGDRVRSSGGQGLVNTSENRDFEFEFELDHQRFVKFGLCNEI